MTRRKLIGQSKERRGLGFLKGSLAKVDELERAPQAGTVIVNKHYGGGTLAPTTFKLPATASDPAYIDGYAIIYFYSTGGVDELRVRGKIGAVETQVTIENLSP